MVSRPPSCDHVAAQKLIAMRRTIIFIGFLTEESNTEIKQMNTQTQRKADRERECKTGG